MKRIWIVVVGVLVVAIGGGAYYYFNRSQGPTMMSPTDEITMTATVTVGTIQETIGASGTVAAKHSADLLWDTSGTIDAVNVTMGQTVKKGDIIATLDQETLPDENILAKSEIIEAEQNLEDVTESDTASANAYQTLLDAQDDYDDAKYAYDKLSQPRMDADTIELAEISLANAQDSYDRVDHLYYNLSYLNDDNPKKAQALESLESAKESLADAQALVNWYKGVPTESEINEKEAALMVAEAALEDAQREYERLKDGPTEDDILAAQAEVDSYQALIDEYKIEAPFDGTITSLDAVTGNIAKENDTAVHIDDLSELYVDLQISEVDINNLSVGQDATITFDSIDDKTYQGTITEVALVGSVSSDSVVYFDVRVKMTDPDDQIRSGLTGVVEVVINERDNVVMVPTSAITTEGEKRYVTVVKDGIATQLEVTTGTSSGTNIEITSGNLSEGDTLQYTMTMSEFQSSTSSDDESSFPMMGGGGDMGPGGGGGAPPGGGGGGMP